MPVLSRVVPGNFCWVDVNAYHVENAKGFYGELFGWRAESVELPVTGDYTILKRGEDQIGGIFELSAEMKAAGTMPNWLGYVGGEPQQPVPRDVVAIMAPPAADGPPPHWSVDFWVANVEEASAKVAERGGEVLAGPYDVPNTGLRQAVVVDPQGASVSLTQPPGAG